MHITFLLGREIRVFDGKVDAIPDMPLGEQVVLDPDDLAERFDERYLTVHGQPRVGEHGFGHDLLYEAQTDTEMDILHVKGVRTAKPDVHHATMPPKKTP